MVQYTVFCIFCPQYCCLGLFVQPLQIQCLSRRAPWISAVPASSFTFHWFMLGRCQVACANVLGASQFSTARSRSKWPLFLKVNPPKQGRNSNQKQGAPFGYTTCGILQSVIPSRHCNLIGESTFGGHQGLLGVPESTVSGSLAVEKIPMNHKIHRTYTASDQQDFWKMNRFSRWIISHIRNSWTPVVYDTFLKEATEYIIIHHPGAKNHSKSL